MDVLDLFLVENRVHLNGHIPVTQDFPSIWNAWAIVMGYRERVGFYTKLCNPVIFRQCLYSATEGHGQTCGAE